MSQRSRMERRSRQFPHGLRHGQNDVCDKTIGDSPSWFFAVFDGIGEASEPKHCPLRLPNPKGIASFSPGCEAGTTLGKQPKGSSTPTGLDQSLSALWNSLGIPGTPHRKQPGSCYFHLICCPSGVCVFLLGSWPLSAPKKEV